MIAHPIGDLIGDPTTDPNRGANRVGGNRGRIPRPVPSRPSSTSLQDQSCYLTVGALCSCDADAHPAVSYAFLGLEPIA